MLSLGFCDIRPVNPSYTSCRIRTQPYVSGTIFSHKGQGSVVDFASFTLIVSKVTLCNLTMADQITLTHKSQINIYVP